MGIMNCYDDISMVISEFSEDDIRRFVSGCEFAVINVSEDVINKNSGTQNRRKFYPIKLISAYIGYSFNLQIDNGDDSNGITLLYIDKSIDEQRDFKQIDGVSISYPSIDELISMLSGKRLIYYNTFFEDHCFVDDIINQHLQEDVFNLRKKDEKYPWDEFFRIQIFLQKASKTDAEEHTMMTPSDPKNYDITAEILSMLKDTSDFFDDDAINIKYELESEQMKALYYFSKFRCDRDWALNHFSILNYRISSFILPGTFPEKKAAELPEDKIVYDITTGEKYVMDSIHINSDICSNINEFSFWLFALLGNIYES